MVSGGYFIIYREIFDHHIFAPEPFTEREAWMWLICSAAWQTCKVRAGSAVIEIERGELIYSTRFMARKWRWTESRVRRFLKRLQGDAMIDARTTHQTTHLTICNYNKYQNQRRTDRREIDAPSDAKKKEEKELIKKEPKKVLKKVARASRLPDDWVPAKKTVEWAYREYGFSRETLYQVLLAFRDYWCALGGARATKISWDRTFKNRCRDLGKQVGRGKSNGKKSMATIAMEMARENEDAGNTIGNIGTGDGPIIDATDENNR